MRRLVLSVTVIALLVVASSVVLYVQARRAAAFEQLSRALDRAGVIAVSARAAQGDDGVLARVAEELSSAPVVHACFYRPDGEATCPEPMAEAAHSRAMVERVLAADSFATVDGESAPATGRFELWYPVTVPVATHTAGPVGPEPPGPGEVGVRVLLLVLDDESGGSMVEGTLLHLVLVTLLVGILIVLTVRQIRLFARERALELEREAERRFAELGRLSAVLAHEIRNPLAAIKGFAQYTARKFGREDPAREDMDMVVAESTRLEHLVNSLLGYARPADLSREEHDLRDVLRRAARLVEHTAAAGKVDVVLTVPDVPARARVDPQQLVQALLNLLMNAVEAAESAEGAGRATAELTATSAGMEIVVADNGAGVDPQLLPDIFEPYVTGKARGTGLGLAVTRRIIEAHGGTISVESPPGKGTRFCVLLPLGVESRGV